MNLVEAMIASVGRRRTRVALVADEVETSYHALNKGSARLAALLRARGVGPGDRVGLMVPNVSEFATVYYGILRVGGVVVSMDLATGEDKLADRLRDADVKLLFAWGAAAEAAETAARGACADCVFVAPSEFDRVLLKLPPDYEVCDRRPDDPAVIMYVRSSASVLTHGEAVSEVSAMRSACAVSEHDVTLGALPLYHRDGQLSVLNLTLSSGGSITLMSEFDPQEAIDLIARDRVTFFPGSLPMCQELLEHLDRLPADCAMPRVCVLDQAVDGASASVLSL